uniref:Uncharacterized protein n=1 Tax=Arundo donax TaxID=35708 RepID=A0A0A8YJD1_ARUDO
MYEEQEKFITSAQITTSSETLQSLQFQESCQSEANNCSNREMRVDRCNLSSMHGIPAQCCSSTLFIS